MFREKLSQVRTFCSDIPSKMGSWGQFFDHHQFSFPSSVTDVTRRCPDNIQVFFANYMIICLLLLIYCLLTSPLLLIGIVVFCILFYGILHRNQDVLLWGKSFTKNQQLIALAVCSIPFFFLFGLTSVFFWVSQ